MLEKSLSNLNLALKINNQHYRIYYCRGIINLGLNRINEAINDFEMANDKSDNNYLRIYFSKGLAYAMGKCY